MKFFLSLFATTTIFLAVVDASKKHPHPNEKGENDNGKVIETPDVFDRRGTVHKCNENDVVNAWCDAHILPDLGCGLLPEFDEYGCTCFGHPNECPTECIGGTEPLLKTHYGIRCGKIPNNVPNYILKERHALQRCEENSLVSGVSKTKCVTNQNHDAKNIIKL